MWHDLEREETCLLLGQPKSRICSSLAFGRSPSQHITKRAPDCKWKRGCYLPKVGKSIVCTRDEMLPFSPAVIPTSSVILGSAEVLSLSFGPELESPVPWEQLFSPLVPLGHGTCTKMLITIPTKSFRGVSSAVRAQRTCIWCQFPKNSETYPETMQLPEVLGSNPSSPISFFFCSRYALPRNIWAEVQPPIPTKSFQGG